MKIKRVKITNEKIIDSLDVSFLDKNGEILDTIIIVGANGSGKSTLLKKIFDTFTTESILKNSEIVCSINEKEKEFVEEKLGYRVENNEVVISGQEEIKMKINGKLDTREYPKIIYMPSELIFNKMNADSRDYSYKYSFSNIINQEMIKDIPSFIATKINDEVYKNDELPAKQVIEKVCNEINSIFSEIEVDAKITGLKKEGEKLPIFKNSFGAEFDINSLSSGEKQLFARVMSLKLIQANNSIILIDEPEISLHPQWQQRIIKVYQSVGKNNQIIVATHSPHIISSVDKECIKILYKKENKEIEEEMSSAYGYNVERVLTEIMGIKRVRTKEVEEEIIELKKMVENGSYESIDFQRRYLKLLSILGGLDQEIILLNMGIAEKKGEKNA